MHVRQKANSTKHDLYQRPTDIRDQQPNIQANKIWKNEHNFNKFKNHMKKLLRNKYMYIYGKY